jgi:predicted nucleic acid-binding protein
MDRVFLDANILFSAAYSEENGLLLFWRLKRIILLTSPYAIEEARRNLKEAAQRERLDVLAGSIEQIPTMSSQSLTVQFPSKDEPIFRAALAGGATHLITGDARHFGALFGKQVMGIWVLRPAAYFKL